MASKFQRILTQSGLLMISFSSGSPVPIDRPPTLSTFLHQIHLTYLEPTPHTVNLEPYKCIQRGAQLNSNRARRTVSVYLVSPIW